MKSRSKRTTRWRASPTPGGPARRPEPAPRIRLRPHRFRPALPQPRGYRSSGAPAHSDATGEAREPVWSRFRSATEANSAPTWKTWRATPACRPSAWSSCTPQPITWSISWGSPPAFRTWAAFRPNCPRRAFPRRASTCPPAAWPSAAASRHLPAGLARRLAHRGTYAAQPVRCPGFAAAAAAHGRQGAIRARPTAL